MLLSRRFLPTCLGVAARQTQPIAASSHPALAWRPSKPPVTATVHLKTGQSVQIIRVDHSQRAQLQTFVQGPHQFADTFITPEITDSVVSGLEWNAREPRHDALVARLVGVGKVVATAELDPDVHEMEAALGTELIAKHGLRRDEVGVIRMRVGAQHHNLGIGTALFIRLLDAAAANGYRAVAGESTNPAIRQIVKKLGGEMQGNQVLVPVRPSGAPPANTSARPGLN